MEVRYLCPGCGNLEQVGEKVTVTCSSCKENVRILSVLVLPITKRVQLGFVLSCNHVLMYTVAHSHTLHISKIISMAEKIKKKFRTHKEDRKPVFEA